MSKKSLHVLRFNRLLFDLRRLSGRDLVIVGASLIDGALREALVRTLKPLSAADRRNMFDTESGAASRLSAKIDLALAIGLITKRTHTETTVLRKLRNLVAHSIDPDEMESAAASSFVASFGYTSSSEIETTVEGAKVQDQLASGQLIFYGETHRYEDLFIAVGGDDRVVWIFPDSDAVDRSRDELVRAQIFACVTAIVIPVLGEWHNDETLADAHPPEAWGDPVTG